MSDIFSYFYIKNPIFIINVREAHYLYHEGTFHGTDIMLCKVISANSSYINLIIFLINNN